MRTLAGPGQTRAIGTTQPERLRSTVSVIVPVFNGEKYIRESLDSILAQTYPPLEILVMDDASTDSTPSILRSYGDRLQVIRQDKNRGIYGNANDGIARAQGDYIAIYHADDVYLPDMIEREVEFLDRHKDAGAVFSNMTFIGPTSEEFGKLELPPEVQGGGPLKYGVILNALLHYTNHFLMCPTAMVRASVYREIGAYRDDVFRNTSDMEMWLRIAKHYPLGILEDRLLRYRHFHDSSSARYHKLRTDPGRYFMIMDLYLDQGGRSLATREALAAHEAHRAEDLLMAAASNYVLDRRRDGRALLSRVKFSNILGSRRIQRWRMLVLALMLHVLLRLPRIPLVAELFRKRWHMKGPWK